MVTSCSCLNWSLNWCNCIAINVKWWILYEFAPVHGCSVNPLFIFLILCCNIKPNVTEKSFRLVDHLHGDHNAQRYQSYGATWWGQPVEMDGYCLRHLRGKACEPVVDLATVDISFNQPIRIGDIITVTLESPRIFINYGNFCRGVQGKLSLFEKIKYNEAFYTFVCSRRWWPACCSAGINSLKPLIRKEDMFQRSAAAYA